MRLRMIPARTSPFSGKELIPVKVAQIGRDEQHAVDARELHTYHEEILKQVLTKNEAS